MKILYTAFDVVPAAKGASVRIQQILSVLSQFAETHAVLLGEPDYPQYEQVCGTEIERLIAPEQSFLERSVTFAEQVLNKVQSWKPEIVQFRSLWDAFPLVAFRQQFGYPHYLVYELHGLPEYELEHHFPDLPRALVEKLKQQQQQVLANVDAILCPSRVHADYLIKRGLPHERIHLVQNGVDLEQFRPADLSQVASHPPQLLYLGTLAPWQGLEGLLESLQWVSQPFQLKLVGKGQRRWQQDLLTRAFQLNLSHAIEMIDALPHSEIPRLIQAADITLAPLDNSDRNRIQGCMPLKILEYMACGKAILAPNLAAVQEILSHQENAYLYPVDDTKALQTGLEYLLAHPEERQRLGKNARHLAETDFAWKITHEQLKSFYRQLLGRARLDSL